MGGLHLGVDYGTSHTVAVLRWPDGRARPLLFDGSPLLSSAVFSTPEGRLLLGRDAQRAARSDPARFEPNPKRRIDEFDVLLGDRALPVKDLIASTLGRVAAEATRIAGAPVDRLTLTHPVAWGPARRKVLREAAGQAGLPEPEFLAEPVAAAAYFTTVLGNRVAGGQSIVVYDLGGGTFDVSVVQRTDDGFDTLAYRGLDDVGGLDLDALVVRHIGEALTSASVGSVVEAWQRLHDPAEADQRRHRLQLWQDAREARETLSREPSATVFVAAAGRDVIITREEFERAASDLLSRTVDTTLATVREARVRPETLAGWFLVGGATRTPLVATMLLRASGRAATIIEEPQLIVADGAVRATSGNTTTQPMAQPEPFTVVKQQQLHQQPPATTAPQDRRSRRWALAGAALVVVLAAGSFLTPGVPWRLDLVSGNNGQPSTSNTTGNPGGSTPSSAVGTGSFPDTEEVCYTAGLTFNRDSVSIISNYDLTMQYVKDDPAQVEDSWKKVMTQAQELSAALTRESTKQVRPEVKTVLRDMIATMNELSSFDNSIGLAKLKTTVEDLKSRFSAACTA